MAKVKVQALRPMWLHARGEEFETSVHHGAALVKVGAARYVPPKRKYKRRDLVAEEMPDVVVVTGPTIVTGEIEVEE